MPRTGPLHVLGVDVGSTNTKVVLVRVDAGPVPAVTEVAVRAAATPAHPDALVRVVRDLVRDTLAGRPAPLAVGVASMAETGAPLDADRRPLTDLIRWDGRRGGEDAERLAARLGRAELFAATGVRASAKVPLVTWAWLRRTRPGVWRRVAHWGGVADLVAQAMTGDLVTDHTLAGRTMAYLLPSPGVPVPGRFDAELLAEVGLVPDQLPRVAAPGEPAGTVVEDAFVVAGVPAGTPVVVAGHDHAVGTWAAGVREPGDSADSIGTAEAVLTVLGAPVDRGAVAGQGMSLVRTAAGTHEALLAGSPAAGGMVSWWSDAVLAGRRASDVLPPEPPGQPSGVVVLPYPHGRQSPEPDPGARVLLDGDPDLPRAAGPPAPVPADVVRATVAMLEGLAHHAWWMLDVQRRLAGSGEGATTPPAAGSSIAGPSTAGPPTVVPPTAVPPVTVAPGRSPLVVLAGAAGANATWMGLKAAVGDEPVLLVTAAEPVATGAALLAAERVGLVPPGSLRLPTRSVPPPAGDRAAWHGARRRFVAAATGTPPDGPGVSRGTA